MDTAQLPKSEEIRLADLALYDIIDTPEEKEFDELRELAAQICDCPISLITLLDSDRQWFKSKQGIDEQGTPRNLSFCSHAILDDGIMVVEDTASDERFFDNPLVTGAHKIRFYAGAPIVSPTGQKLGTICVIDRHPRKFTAEQYRALEILSNQITKLLELRLKSKVIEQRANEIIKIKNKATIDFINELDKEHFSVAKELHENIAQELAASRLYLNMAVSNESGRLAHIQEANQSIGNVLTEIKNLSYSISPSTVESVSIQVMLENVLHVQETYNSFETELKISERAGRINFAQAINCTKIVESWLQVLYAQSDISFVSVQIDVVENEIKLCIEDNAVKHCAKEREKDLISGMVYYRVIGMNGTMQFAETERGTNLLCVNFPLREK
jgi:GAF domain-containing protein